MILSTHDSKNQSNFIFLREFDIVLTNAFFSFVFNTMFNSNFSIFAFESICEIFEKSTKSCSSFSQKQHELKIKSEISKFKKILKTEQIVKSISTFQNIDIFDSTTCNESKFELYNVIANFLQNFQ